MSNDRRSRHDNPPEASAPHADPNNEKAVNAMNASHEKPNSTERPENAPELQALFAERYDTEAPAGLLDDLLAEIPEQLDVPSSDERPTLALGGAEGTELGADEPVNAGALADGDRSTEQDNVVRGRFGRLTALPSQTLAAAAALVVLIGAGWLAVRLGPGTEQRVARSLADAAPRAEAPASASVASTEASSDGSASAVEVGEERSDETLATVAGSTAGARQAAASPPSTTPPATLGSLVGRVTDAEGTALPGVRVTLLGGNRPPVQLTGFGGRFRFVGIESGTYALRAELEGFGAAEYPDASVAPAHSTRVDLVLEAALEETIVVTSESPLLDERRLSRGTKVSESELEGVPTARDPWQLLNQTPGSLVDRTNVGGSEARQQSVFREQGVETSESDFMVDGVQVQDARAASRSETYYDFDQFADGERPMPPPLPAPASEPPPRRPVPPPPARPTEGARLRQELSVISESVAKEKKTEKPTDTTADSRFERLWTADHPSERGGRADLAELEPAPRTAPPLTDPSVDPQSTFGLDVDTGSYTAIRAAIRSGRLPDPQRIRPEEVLNWFRFDDPAPDHRAASDFAITAEAGRAQLPLPGATSRRVIRFSVNARDLSAIPRKPAVLTFVVDTSGSMRTDGRLKTVQQALGVLLDNLEPRDRVALIAYSDGARLLSQATADKEQLRRAIQQLYPSGSTNLQSGMQFGYAEAERAFEAEAINRVILLSDGIANVGQTEAVPILQSVADWAQRGIELTTIGVGMLHNDELLERLADRGDGNYAYVDTFREARRVFEEELTGTLLTVASDVRAQVTFDPRVVAGYRLIGYENRALPDQMFRNDSVDAGEIGSGHRVNVLYEVELWADRPRAERTGDVETSRRIRRPAATLDLRWRSKRTKAFEETRVELPVATFFNRRAESPRLTFAGLVVTFAEELRSGRPSPQRLEQMAEAVENVAPQVPEVPAGEIAFLMREAADLARR